MKKNLSQLPWDRIILCVTACLILALGICTLIGWATHNALLMQISTSFPPMKVNAALCFIFSGFSLLFIHFSKKTPAILAACIVLLLSTLTLCQYLFKIDIGIDQWLFPYDLPYYSSFPGRMPINSSICFLLSGICLIITAYPQRRVSSLFAEILSGIVGTIATIILFEYITGFSSIIGWSDFNAMALHASIGFLILSIGLFNYHFIRSLYEEKFSYGPALNAFFFTTGITIAIWQSFNAQQYLNIQKLAQNNADYIADDLKKNINDLGQALTRMNLRSKTADNYSEAIWNIDAQRYIDDFSGLTSINWYNDQLELQRSTSNSAPTTSSLMELMSRIKSEGLKESIYHISYEETLFLLFPLFSSTNTFKGILVTGINPKELIEKSIPPFALDNYGIEVFDENECIYTKNINIKPIGKEISAEVGSPFVDWNIKVFPTQKSLSIIESYSPNFILITGFFITFSTMAIVLLAQSVFRSKKSCVLDLEEKANALAYQTAVFNSSNYSIISTDPKGTILSFNKAAEKMLLWKADEMIGKLSPGVFHDKQEMIARAHELSEKLGETILPGFDVFVTMAKGGMADEREWTYIRKDESRFPVQLSVTAVKNSRGEIIGFVGIAYDLTPSKELDRMKNELIGMTSHELRAPLTSIKGSLDLISTHDALSDEAKSLMNIALKNCDRLIKLTNDILDVQKMESGKMEFHFKNISLPELLRLSVEMNQTLAQNYQVILQEPIDVPNYIIHGDEDRLIQVTTNLISNAIKYSPKNAPVSFVVSKHDHCIRVGIKDCGEGIPKKFQPLLFQKFSQVPSNGSSVKGGSGLGLNICKLIITAHGGTIGFDTSPQGSVFWFELPIVSS